MGTEIAGAQRLALQGPFADGTVGFSDDAIMNVVQFGCLQSLLISHVPCDAHALQPSVPHEAPPLPWLLLPLSLQRLDAKHMHANL